MQASTASACFRKLSDWVNSVSKHQASSRVIAVFSGIYWAFVGVRTSTILILHSFLGFHAAHPLTLPNVCRKVRVVSMDLGVVELIHRETVPCSGTPTT